MSIVLHPFITSMGGKISNFSRYSSWITTKKDIVSMVVLVYFGKEKIGHRMYTTFRLYIDHVVLQEYGIYALHFPVLFKKIYFS